MIILVKLLYLLHNENMTILQCLLKREQFNEIALEYTSEFDKLIDEYNKSQS